MTYSGGRFLWRVDGRGAHAGESVVAMLNRETDKPDLAGAREMKVKIPLDYHVRLHSVKILTGRSISNVVTEALTAYFAEQDDQ